MNDRKREPAINPVIELMRGVAALMVVYAHYWKMAGIEAGLTGFSYTGVDLFFVLSGFVFAPYFFGQPLQTAPFFIRRFFRIYPLYLVGVVLYWLLKQGWIEGSWSLLAKHLLFLHTWQNYQIAYALNPAFWSLPPEVEFYLLLPLIARFVQGMRSVSLLFIAAIMLRLGLDWLSPPEQGVVNQSLILSFHLPGLLSEFLCGAIAWKIVQSSMTTALRT
ncbi:MAG TPA: acyltransferase, partial [Candidatus Acidoferrum sp.]|nr:acyltransferase [Candidatus Acidoferrum sp.]